MAELPDHDSFARHLGETFVLRPPEGDPVEVELLEAAALPGRQTNDEAIRRDPFSLLFRASGASSLPQQVYRVEHSALGELDIFLVPIGPDEVGMRFEAIFN
jgi:hypothetical protein